MSELTVAITATGRPDFLRTALQSVLNQVALSSIGEVIVSENSSDRRTEAVAREFPELPVRYRFREPTLPMIAHLFTTFREVRTPYVAILNDDDWWNGNHVADGVRALNSGTHIAAYTAASVFVGGEEQRNPHWIDRSAAIWLLASRPSWVSPWDLDTRIMLALCWAYTPFHWSSLITRTAFLASVLDELEKATYYTHTIDRLLFAGLALHGRFRYNPVPDTFVRWHSGNWVNSQNGREIRRVLRSTADVVDAMCRERECDAVSIWKTTLSRMPVEMGVDVFGRFLETFTTKDLTNLGLTRYFRNRPRNFLLAALRNIAANAKKLAIGF